MKQFHLLPPAEKIRAALTQSRPWFIACAVFIGIFRLLPALRHDLYNMDEGITLSVGYAVAHGGLPYVDSVCQRGPMLHSTAAAVFKLFGDWNVVAWNLTGLAFFSVTALLVWLIAKELFGKQAANLAMTLFVVFSSVGLILPDAIGINAEQLANVPACAALYLLVRFGRNHLWSWFASGFLAMIAGLYKQVMMVLAFLIALWGVLWLIDEWKKNKHPLALFFLRGGLAFIGFALPFLVTVAIFARAKHLQDFWYWFYQYNISYRLAGIELISFSAMAAWFFNILLVKLFPLTLGCLVGLYLAFRHIQTGAYESGHRRISVIFAAVWAIASVYTATMAYRPFGYYFVQATPPMSVLAAAGFLYLIGRERKLSVARSAGRVVVALLVVFSLINALFNAYIMMVQVFHDFVPSLDEDWATDRTYYDVALRVQEASSKNDSVFVWGFLPRVYPLSARKPATKFSSGFYLAGQYGGLVMDPNMYDLTPHIVPGAWKQTIRAFNINKPQVIVDASTIPATVFTMLRPVLYPLLDETLAKNYRKYAKVGYCTIYVRTDKKWQRIFYDPKKEYAVQFTLPGQKGIDVQKMMGK